MPAGRRGRPRRIAVWAVRVLLVLAALTLLLQHALPHLLQNAAVKALSRPGLNVRSLGVRRVGLGGLDLADIEARVGPGVDVRVGRASVDYSPAGLLRHELGPLTISGVEVVIPLDGLGDGPGAGNGEPSHPPAPRPGSGAAGGWRVVRAHVDLATLVLAGTNGTLRVPFTLSAQSQPALANAGASYEADIRAQPWNADMRLSVRVASQAAAGMARGRVRADAAGKARGIPLNELAAFLGLESTGLAPHGLDIGLTAGVDLQAAPCAAGKMQIRLRPGRAQAPSRGLQLVTPLDVDTAFDLKAGGDAPGWRVTVTAQSDVEFLSGAVKVRMPDTSFRGDLRKQTGPLSAACRLTCSALTVDIPPLREPAGDSEPPGPVVFRDLAILQEIDTGPAGTVSRGPLDVGAVSYGALQFSGLTGTLSVSAGDIALAGAGSTPLPGVRIDFDGTVPLAATAGQAGFSVRVPDTCLTNSVSLAGLHPAVPPILFSGRVSLEAGLRRTGDDWRGTGCLRLADADFEWKARQVRVSGLSTRVELADLPALRSGHDTDLRFDALNIGTLSISNGTVVYEIQDPQTLYIQKAGGEWCGGTLSLSGLRIDAGSGDAEGMLTCDRVQLSELLRLLGLSGVEGEGELNGRLPFRWRGRDFAIENGYFQTTPGTGGEIAVPASGFLTKFVNRHAPQYVYVDITEEALKAFEYQWARLDVNLGGGTLNVELGIRGRPKRKLPFEFDLATQAFERVKPKRANVNFDQGIELHLRMHDILLKDILFSREALELIFKSKAPSISHP
ncbi:MAG: YdbH domain-containing protein [Kiritimatiellae bacterium]|nr:YdbH domain-containing protein [Kiritimatiellia bacterium]